MKKQKTHKVGDCLRWSTGTCPSKANRCHNCGIGPCSFTDLVLSGRGQRRKKRWSEQSPGNRYPRERSDSNAELRLVHIYKASWGDPTPSYVNLESEFRRMREFTRSHTGCVEVLNFHHWSHRDDVLVYTNHQSDHVKYHVALNALQIFIRNAALEVWEDEFSELHLTSTPWVVAHDSRQRAIRAMKPSLTTGFSLLNFLVELKDFKSFFDGSLLRELKHLSPIDKNGVSVAKLSLSRLADLAALGQLTWSFAIKPLISDVQKVVSILLSFEERTRRFIERSTALSARRHFGADIPVTALADRTTFEVDDGNVVLKCAMRFEPQTRPMSSSPKDHCRYQATMDFNYHVQQLVEINSQLAGLLQQLGVRPDASILWNALPFSFIVDWFARVGSWLEANYSVDVMSAALTVHDWIESYRIRYAVDILSLTPYSETCQPLVTTVSTVAHGEVYYRRTVIPPDPDVWVDIDVDKGIDLDRAILGAALVKRLLN